jgi:hypothetical protein
VLPFELVDLMEINDVVKAKLVYFYGRKSSTYSFYCIALVINYTSREENLEISENYRLLSRNRLQQYSAKGYKAQLDCSGPREKPLGI